MKIGIQTWGSNGDIRPFLALAQGLQAAGNEVHLVVTCVDSDACGEPAPAPGLSVSVIGSPVLTPAQQEEIGRTAYSIRNPLAQMAAILRQCFAPAEDLMFEAARRLAADSDLLIGHYFMHPLQVAAEHAGKPYVSVLLSHAAIPSAFNHPLGKLALGKTVHRLLWRLMRTLLNGVLLPYPNRLRARLGMAPLRDIVTQAWLSQALTLAAVSPQICRRQPDWPAWLQVCGFLDQPGREAGLVPAPVAAFLDAGEAPVFMTFGSWMPNDLAGQARALRLLTDAARLAGCRAIIQGDGASDCGLRSDGRILYVGAVPHGLVFPRCRLVVHHGGAGTTQSATLAGKPSVIVANISEQEFWAGELRHLGIAPKLARRRNVTPAALAGRIRQVLARPAMEVRAQAIGRAMQDEDGVAEAVARIMQRFGSAASDPATPGS